MKEHTHTKNTKIYIDVNKSIQMYMYSKINAYEYRVYNFLPVYIQNGRCAGHPTPNGPTDDNPMIQL